MSKDQKSAPVIELTERELTSVQGGLTIIRGEDKRVPEGVTFTPRAPSPPEPPRAPAPPFPGLRGLLQFPR